MIPIKINNKKYSIKSIQELTTKEFIELSEIDFSSISTNDMFYIKYIEKQSGCSFEDVFFTTIKESLKKHIGIPPDITKLPTPIVDYIDYNKNIQTIGQRHQVEESNLKNFELLVFILAVAQAQNPDISKVYELRDYYMNKPFVEILPAGFFFFKIYRNGKSRGLNILIWLMSLIRIKLSKSKQA